ncbi:hypothetical protein SAMN05216554_1086 [Herbiconiux ginsengi]|uniref:Uncharacterized protein n=1 Tax=Herbiconiux ginsengi TaxID=381665 RepID=A0A1H3LRL0_9MICO|nr:hypothetical protein SAMN05216554_1086 [Herbiconiux ginsengi]
MRVEDQLQGDGWVVERRHHRARVAVSEPRHRWADDAPATDRVAAAHDTISREVRERYGIDIDQLQGDPSEVIQATRDLAEQRAAETRLRAHAGVDEARTALLLAEAGAYDVLAAEQRSLADDLTEQVNWERGDDRDLAVYGRAGSASDAATSAAVEAERLRAEAAGVEDLAAWRAGHADRLGAESAAAEEALDGLTGQLPLARLREDAAAKDKLVDAARGDEAQLSAVVEGPRTPDVPHDIEQQHAQSQLSTRAAATTAAEAHERAGDPSTHVEQLAIDDYRAQAADWDTPGRLDRLRGDLVDRQVDPEVIQSRLITERGRRTPPSAAVQGTPKQAPKARKGTSRNLSKDNELGL